MINKRKLSYWILAIGIALVAIGGLTWGIAHMTGRTPPPVAKAGEKDPARAQEQGQEPEQHDAKVSLAVVHPKKGLLDRLTTQPGSIQAYESVRLFAKVPGFLKWQNIVTDKGERPLDIGDRVKRGQKLAVVDVPELETQVRRNAAAVKQARSRVVQMQARVASAEADLLAAKPR